MRLLFLLLFFIRLINQLAAQATFPERNLTNHPGNDRYASYSPDGQWIVFESDRNGRWDIFLMDAEGGQLSQLTDLPAGCRRPSWHPNGRKVLFESTRNGATALFEIHTDGSGQKELLRLDTETDAGLFAVTLRTEAGSPMP